MMRPPTHTYATNTNTPSLARFFLRGASKKRHNAVDPLLTKEEKKHIDFWVKSHVSDSHTESLIAHTHTPPFHL
jgi:hypothetical protein